MARPFTSSFANLLLHQNPKSVQNPSLQLRNIANYGSEDALNQDLSNPVQHKFSDVAKDVCRIIRTKSRWERTLASDFPTVNFSDSCFLNEVLRNQQDAILSMRLLRWVNSRFGVSPEEESCRLVFEALVKAKAAKAAVDFLGFSKFTPEPASLESLVRRLCERKMIDEAVGVFDELKKMGTKPSLKMWNSALRGSIKVGRTDVVWKLYGEMIEFGVGSDNDTVGYLIQAFCMENNVSKGYELLRQVLEAGYVPDISSFNKLISGFVKSRNFTRVSELLHIMIAKNRDPDILTYNEIIRGLCKVGKSQEAFRIFNDIKDRGYAPNVITYNIIIIGLCKIKLIGEARELFFEMTQKGMVPTKYTYNEMISGYFSIGNVEEAHKLFKEMCDRGCGKTTVSYTVMIKGLCSQNMVEEACHMFQQMQQKDVAPDVITYHTLLSGLCTEGKIFEGVNLLYELLHKGLQPSADSYTILIEKLSESGHVDEAKTLWNDSIDRGVKPAAFTFDCIIRGLSNVEDDAEAIEWLDSMLKYGFVPRRDTFVKLLYNFLQRDKKEDVALILHCLLNEGYELSEHNCYSLVRYFCQGSSNHVKTCIDGILKSS